MIGIWNKHSLEFQARTTARGNMSSLQPFKNIRQFEVWSSELSIWVLRVSPFFVSSISVSYFSFLCLLLRLLEAYSSLNSTHSATGISMLYNQSFSGLLCNCWFVDWGLTFSSKGRLLRSGILCKVTVYESVIFPTSCCLPGEWDGNTQRWAEKTHTGLYRITVQILEKNKVEHLARYYKKWSGLV